MVRPAPYAGSGCGVDSLESECITKVSEASPANPMVSVGGRPPFQLGIRIVTEHVVPEVNPTEGAVVVIQVWLVGRPRPPLEGRSLEETLLARNPWIVLASHASSLSPKP